MAEAQAQQRPRNNNNNNGLPDVIGWFWSLPPVTRTWFGLAVAVNAATSLDLLPHEDLIFDWTRVIEKMELWRCITSFLYAGGQIHELHVLWALHMIAMQSSIYETNPHIAGSGSPRADYVFCLLFCCIVIIITYLLQAIYVHGYLYPLFTRTLLTSITYLWSRRNANVNVMFLFIPVQGQYLPFCHIGLALALQNPIYELLHGMLVGHLYYYLVEVVPSILGGRRVLMCPAILREIVHDIYGAQEEFRQQQNQQQAQQRPQPRNTININAEMQRRFQGEGAREAHIAAKINNLQRLQRLAMTEEGRAQFAVADNNGWQPLHEAVRGGHLDVVNLLINHHADQNAKTNHGISPLWLAEDSLGPDHPVTKRLQELGAEKHGPER
ncbi:Derlin-3 [Seminavis robusta]|uniref:Derlin n=1 Tax=Seminavis robusta TaxID=568900 RepID=A0A9N8E6A2_9STRA|nr:Derlin-3 [Seminavis robusta]|eukprot:Sro717_g192100.1 Derlin-3 (383) ;mRNA; f:46839-47987